MPENYDHLNRLIMKLNAIENDDDFDNLLEHKDYLDTELNGNDDEDSFEGFAEPKWEELLTSS